MTINVYFEDGFHGTLTHESPRQISEWASLLGRPDFMKDCKIVSVSISLDEPETSPQDAA